MNFLSCSYVFVNFKELIFIVCFIYRVKGKCYNVFFIVFVLYIFDDVVFWFIWNGISIVFCYLLDNMIFEWKFLVLRNVKYVEIYRNLNVNFVKG